MKTILYRSITILIIVALLLLNSGCSRMIKALNSGYTGAGSFTEVIEVEEENGLLILPVSIGGKNYRFLFDTGAPFCISEEMQAEHGFKRLAKNHIKDSDGNSKKVEIVQVDETFIQGIEFSKQSAFVLDMRTHPIINCMNIDGIIGSNLMRFCNWEVDMEKLSITISNTSENLYKQSAHIIPFSSDFQYNILTNLQYDTSRTMSVQLDYGSNGYLSLNKHSFQYLKEYGLFDTTYLINGFTQSGIVAKKEKQDGEMAYCDKLAIEGLPLDSMIVKSGKSSLLGTSLLSRYIVGIDWDNKKLLLEKKDSIEDNMKMLGMNISYSTDKGFYVLSVVDGSPAQQHGILPDMEIVKVDNITFSHDQDYCEFIDKWVKRGDSLTMTLKDEDGNTFDVFLQKSILPSSAQ